MSTSERVSSSIKLISEGLGDPSVDLGSETKSCSPRLWNRGCDIFKNIF